MVYYAFIWKLYDPITVYPKIYRKELLSKDDPIRTLYGPDLSFVNIGVRSDPDQRHTQPLAGIQDHVARDIEI